MSSKHFIFTGCEIEIINTHRANDVNITEIQIIFLNFSVIFRVVKHKLSSERQSLANNIRDGAEHHRSISILSFSFLLHRNALELKLVLHNPSTCNTVLVRPVQADLHSTVTEFLHLLAHIGPSFKIRRAYYI